MDKKESPELIKAITKKNIEGDLFLNKKYTYIDLLGDQLDELTQIYKLIGKKPSKEDIRGCYVRYDSRNTILKVLPKKSFLYLLTSRNRNLITSQEQNNFQNLNISVAGLSVGSNICSTIAMQGGSLNMSVADHDIVSTSNLNRVGYDLFDVGKSKIDALLDKIWRTNPYIKFKVFKGGLNVDNIDDFVSDSDVIYDEIDNLKMKILLRERALFFKKPIIMITDNGDNIMIDIERYDLNEDLDIFHGLLDEKDIDLIKNCGDEMTISDRVSLSLKIVGPHNAVPRMQESLLDVGKTINTWPQLGTASMLAGAVGSYIARMIANNQPLKTGRMHLSIDSIIVPGYDSEDNKKMRDAFTKDFIRNITKK